MIPRGGSYHGIEDPKRTEYDKRFYQVVEDRLPLQGYMIRPIVEKGFTPKGIYISASGVDMADFEIFFNSLKRMG